MILKDLKVRELKGEDSFRWEIWADVIIKRHDRLWKVKHVRRYEFKEEKAGELYEFINDFIRESEKIYHLYKVDEEFIERSKEEYKPIGAFPFEIEDEEMTKEEFELKVLTKVIKEAWTPDSELKDKEDEVVKEKVEE